MLIKLIMIENFVNLNFYNSLRYISKLLRMPAEFIVKFLI